MDVSQRQEVEAAGWPFKISPALRPGVHSANLHLQMPHYPCARSPAVLWMALVAGALAVLPAGAQVAQRNPPAQAVGKGPLLLQRIDDVLWGVDPISLAVVDRQHVSAILVRVNAHKPSPPLNYSHFVADCRGAMQLAVLSSAASPMDLTPEGASARARAQAAASALASGSAKFVKLHMLDGSRALAEFACAASQRPSQAAALAKEVLDNGGPRDMRAALCDLQPDGVFVTREDVTVRFSDSEKVVSVNHQWLSSGKVTDTEISFGSGSAKWRIDRNSAEASLIDSTGKILFAGSCVAQPKR